MADSPRTSFLQQFMSLPCPPDLEALRKSAAEKIRTSPLPSTSQEAWKYLELSAVYSQTFAKPTHNAHPPQAPNECLAPETAHSRLVFVNGLLDSNLSDTSAIGNDIHFTTLAKFSSEFAPHTASAENCGSAIAKLANSHSTLATITHLGKLATPDKSDLFANLNTAYFEDGAILYVPRGQSLDIPLHLVFQSNGINGDGKQPVTFPRILLVLGQEARAHIVEEYCGHGKYLTCPVVEIVLGKGASLRHDRVQRESHQAFHFCTLNVNIANSASYSSTSISMGAAISRHNPKIALLGEYAELELNGLSMISNTQTADTHSLIDHAVASCTSRQLQKNIVGDSAHGIFNGQIMVHSDAQQTNASQSSRNLLLSEKARIDTSPQLEIFADDVKCSHGATVGQLDADELFYLQSRGLDLNSARNLLTAGFAADVLNHIALHSLRHKLIKYV